MRILHIAPNAPYNDYWGYQENLLPKYHAKLNHDVTVITPNLMHENGRIVETDCADYILDDGVRVIRLQYKNCFNRVLTAINTRLDVGNLLDAIEPDFIFFHGLISSTILDVIKYKKKNPECVIVCDTHQDGNNSSNIKSKKLKSRLLHGYYIMLNKYTQKYVEKIYGVTPCRIDFAQDYFKISPDKTDLLIMGACDEKINFAEKEVVREGIRKELGVDDGVMLVVTGGKIEPNKKICELMDAVKGMESKVKLLVFGTPVEGYETIFSEHLNENVISIGWIHADEVYDYFLASDLAFFPGLHSVLWEQACASKLPCVFRRLEGMHHVDCGGNSDFIDDVTVDGIKNKITELMFTDKYFKMKEVAESSKTDIYLYSNIAKKSLEVFDI